jgi:hypothetical protein
MHALVAVQAAFCFLVLFVVGLFVATFERLSNQPTGFSADRPSCARDGRSTRSVTGVLGTDGR